jgi:hypothetical protein
MFGKGECRDRGDQSEHDEREKNSRIVAGADKRNILAWGKTIDRLDIHFAILWFSAKDLARPCMARKKRS